MERIQLLYWNAFLSWNSKRLLAARYKKKALMSLSTFQANRYIDKYLNLTEFSENDKKRIKAHFLR